MTTKTTDRLLGAAEVDEERVPDETAKAHVIDDDEMEALLAKRDEEET